MKLYDIFSIFSILSLTAASASAEVLMTCNEPRGHLYVVGVGWVDDGHTDGYFQLVADGDEYDIFIKDVYGTRSAKADGAIVTISESTDDAMTLIVAYPKSLETFLFDFSTNQMIMAKQKISGKYKLGGVYQAECE